MSLVGRVGRKRPRARLALAFLYMLLVLGAITTLYPFVLMVSTGLKGPTDQNDNQIIPAYMQSESDLLTKYIDDKYAGDATMIASTRIGADASPELVAQYNRFLTQLPNEYWVPGFRMAPNQVTSRLNARYQTWLRQRYRNDIGALNRAYVEENVAFQTAVPPSELPERATWNPPDTIKWREWQEFKAALPAEYRIPLRSDRLYQEYLRARFQNRWESVPTRIAGTATRFEEARPVDYASYRDFVDHALPARFRVNTADTEWSRFLGRANPMPIAAAEAAAVRAESGPIRREFAGRNFVYVLDYILINGRAVLNTFIFCALAVLTQLIVNPLAAYGLSRYPVRQSGAILIFLLATMAFPAEVAMIPSFLLLRDLGLLNTFAALVLPAAASGYMIFLLKGFFDSLPSELFEAGQLDGAKEVTMLRAIALPLSRPVFGYLALIAFMGAYGSFIYAFLIAQDQNMWTLMVWIYQLQNIAPKSVMMAALTLAAIPTLVVFLLAQRAILKGIVLPGER